MRIRVGVRQFLVLGALSQMPGQSIELTDLSKHVNRVAPGTHLLQMLSTLESAGFVVSSDGTNEWALTDLGASALCERRRAETTVFARVADSIMVAYAS